jgi:ribonucleoside-diphosphate reductase alpha chain
VPDLHDLYGKAFEEKYLEYEAKAEAGKIIGREDPGPRPLEEHAQDAL